MSSKQLLRGIFVDGGDAESVTPNCMRLIEAVESGRYKFQHPDEDRVYCYARDFFREHGGPPSLTNLYHELKSLPNNERDFVLDGEVNSTALEKGKDIAVLKLTTHAEYKGTLAVECEQYRRSEARRILGQAQEIVTGKKFQKVRLEGVEAAYSYAFEKLGPLVETPGRPARSDVLVEGKAVVEEYQAAKARPPGLLCGLEPIDGCFGGIRPGELWTHAAFTGHLKTTCALNWAYHATIGLEANVLYVSLEMPPEQLRRLAFALHSANPKFCRPGLDYSAVKDGRLTHADEEHLRAVAADAAGYKGKLIVWSPAETPGVKEIGAYAELINNNAPIGLVVIDHSELVRPASKDRDYNARLNSVFVEAKRLALGFAGGQGVPLLMLHQLNRESARDSEKGKPISLFHLAAANQAERSSDYITSSLADEERRARSVVQIGCLKNREGRLFPSFEAAVNFPSRRISVEQPEMFDFSIEDV